jgi:hypothetical protein
VTRRFALATLLLLLTTGPVVADDMAVQVDPRADLSRFRTFAIRTPKVNSPRPELDNPLMVKGLGRTIRVALAARGLKEATTAPDLVVDYTLTSEDVALGVPTAVRGLGPRPERYTEGTLVIDLIRPGDTNPVWRGTYRDDERTGSKLVQKLPEDARKLIGRYPQVR